MIAFAGVCHSQLDRYRPYYSGYDQYPFQGFAQQVGPTFDQVRGNVGSRFGEEPSPFGNPFGQPVENRRPETSNRRPESISKKTERSNCKRDIEGFETGFCREIPEDRDLEQSHDELALAADMTEFALQLFKAANRPEVENQVLSGISPQILLSYLNWASDGITRDEMKKAKVFGSPKNAQKLISRMLSSTDKREMNIATAFFTAPDLK